jgi:tetratricopeptide (TPR) repeat protein
MLKKLLALTLLSSILWMGCSGQDQLAAGKKLLEEQKFQEAETFFLDLSGKEAENAFAWNGLGNARMGLGKLEEAKANLAKAVDLGHAQKLQNEDLGKFYFDKAFLEYSMVEYDQSNADFQNAIDKGYKSSESHAYKAVGLSAMGDDITALKLLSKAIELDPSNHFAFANRGYINSKLGDNKTALSDLGKAIELQPDDKVAYLNRGYTYIGMGDYATAMKDIDKSLELDPEYLGAIAYKGIALTNMGQPKEALPWLDRSIKMQPDNPAFFYYRGVARLNTADIEGGCADLKHAAANGHYDGEPMRRQYCPD